MRENLKITFEERQKSQFFCFMTGWFETGPTLQATRYYLHFDRVGGKSSILIKGEVRNIPWNMGIFILLNTVVELFLADSTFKVIHTCFLQGQEEKKALIFRHVPLVPPETKDLELEEEVKESAFQTKAALRTSFLQGLLCPRLCLEKPLVI